MDYSAFLVIWRRIRDRRSASSWRSFLVDLSDFAQFAGVRDPGQAAHVLLVQGSDQAHSLTHAYRESLIARNVSPATANHRLSSLRTLTKTALALGRISWCLHLKSIPISPCPTRYEIGREGILALLMEASQQPNAKKSARDVALIWCLVSPALRVAEVCALQQEDVDFPRQRIRIENLEGETWLRLPMPTWAALTTWREHHEPLTGPLFIRLDRGGKGQALTARGLLKVIMSLGRRGHLVAQPRGLRAGGIALAMNSREPVCSVRSFARVTDLTSRCLCDDDPSDRGSVTADAVANSIREGD